ncbi:MAG: hypothetical protein KF745_12120 [Phycisphaeraceae bacterium]|nr:hypothetical protein [Phycisphaeraceae bacterium]
MKSRSCARGAAAAAIIASAAGVAMAGPDVIVGELPDLQNYGGSGGKHAYAVGTTSCNIGDQVLDWYSGTNQHPVISQNLYRLMNGRFEQIGQAWLKHGFCSLQGNVCNTCNGDGNGCNGLGTNCSDPYSSGLNGTQSGLGPKSEVNAATGFFPYPWINNGSGSGTLFKRLQANDSDLGLAGAQYFVSSMYVQPQDALAGNDNNNESYRQVTIGGAPNYTMSLTGATQRMKPGIQAWKDMDASVTLTNVDIAGDGRFIIGSKATSLGGGQYRYEYAVMNLNSDRSGQSFSIPLPSGAVVSNTGFHDVDYHSGEPYSGTDWSPAVTSSAITWSTQTFAQNANANALRWDTIYNFRFDCNVAPGSGGATIGLFKSGSPASGAGLAIIPGGGPLPPPSNDNCANNLTVSNGTTSFDTTAATTDGPAETLCNVSSSDQIGQDIWFKYVATGTGSTTFSLCGSSYDTRIAIYAGASCPAGVNTAIACNDDSNTCGTNSLQSNLVVATTAGQTYLIRVGGYQALFGAGTLTITAPTGGGGGPVNNDCANATTIAYPSTTAFSTAGATTDGPAESGCGFCCNDNQIGSDIWYRITPCASGTVTVSTCGASYDTKLGIYPNSCPVSSGTQIACNDDNGPSCQTTRASVSFTAVAGTTYLIRVGGYNAATGTGNLVITGPTCPVAPTNNDCANRIGLGLGTQAFSTANATTDGPSTFCGQIGQDIWYNHPAQCTGQLTLSLCTPAPSFNTVMAVYANAGCTNLATRLITCNDNAGGACPSGASQIKINIVQGRNYTIRIGGVGSATGTGTITASCVAHCRADWDGNGVIDPADIAVYINDWSGSVGAGTLLGDFDNTGTVDPSDIAQFISQWLADLQSGNCS